MIINELPTTKLKIDHITDPVMIETAKSPKPYLQIFSNNKLQFSSLSKK